MGVRTHAMVWVLQRWKTHIKDDSCICFKYKEQNVTITLDYERFFIFIHLCVYLQCLIDSAICAPQLLTIHPPHTCQFQVKRRTRSVCIRAKDALCNSKWSEWSHFRSVPRTAVKWRHRAFTSSWLADMLVPVPHLVHVASVSPCLQTAESFFFFAQLWIKLFFIWMIPL